MHRAFPWRSSRLGTDATRAHHYYYFFDDRVRFSTSLCAAFLESKMAQTAAEAGRMDGKIQNGDGFSNGCNRRLAAQFRFNSFRKIGNSLAWSVPSLHC